ncbi:MAG: SDR family oxidoreductase [Acidobacteriota bacterium]
MDLGIAGKLALVGGASKGLGRACAHELAAEGARVSLCSRDGRAAEETAAKIAAATRSEVAGFACDLARDGAAAAWVAASRERFGPVSILVHNAGGPPPGDFDDLDDTAWTAAVQLVLLSAVRLFRAVLPDMREAGWGRIVAIESISVKEPIEGLLLSNALRPGVVAVCKSLARQVAREGIVVNCVAPGFHHTDRTRQLGEVRARQAGITLEEYQRRAVESFPRGRPGEPGELAAGVAFLCSTRAANINGALLSVDGGASRGLF